MESPSLIKGWNSDGTLDPKLEKFINLSLHHSFKPHPAQIKILRAVLKPPEGAGVRKAFIRCGRKFGKSSICAYISLRSCLRISNFRAYLLAPQYKQAKEIYWASRVIPYFLSLDGEESPLIKRIDNQDTRLEFVNGSFLKIDGSDNYDSQRGWNPDLVVADEYAEFDSRWLEVMEPNVLARQGLLMFIGTPPRDPLLPNGDKHQYVKKDAECQYLAKEGKAFWMQAPSTCNPFIPPEVFQEEKEKLIRAGEEITWKREYLAEIVQGGARAIFPMLDREIHVVPHGQLMKKIQEDPDRYEYYCGADPGTKSVFGVLFIAFDRYTATPYYLDCIYETRPGFCTVQNIVPRIREKLLAIYPQETSWVLFCDSAASWFIEEAAQEPYEMWFAPTKKRAGDKEKGIAQLRDILLTKREFISSECEPFVTEMQNYATNDRGLIPKAWDHCLSGCTIVHTADGPRLIEELVGTTGKLYSFDNKLQSYFNVRQTRRGAKTIKLTFDDNSILRCTPEHKLLNASQKWVEAQALLVGEELMTRFPGVNRKLIGVKSANQRPVYNLEVSISHCFAVNSGIIVHNCIDLARYGLEFMGYVAKEVSYSPKEETFKAPVRPGRGFTTKEESDGFDDENMVMAFSGDY